jgi:poly-gamma-glutamate synthesis protein (capsule biosynthesis protein)
MPFLYIDMTGVDEHTSQEIFSKRREFVSIVAVGDSIGYNIKLENLSHLSDLIVSDIFIFNLEGALTEPNNIQECRKLPNQSLLTSSPNFVGYMKLAPVTIANLANNHVLDCGPNGLEEGKRYVLDHGMLYVGAGKNLAEACDPLFVEVNDMKIAFLSYNFVQLDLVSADASAAGAASLDGCDHDYDSIGSKADVIVASIHIGIWSEKVDEEQIKIVNRLFDSGVEVVIGHSAHMPQAVMTRDGKVAFFSLGNFIFRPDYEMPSKAHAAIMPRIDIYNDRIDVTVYPIKIDDSGIPHLDENKGIISKIVNDSKAFSTEMRMKENLGYFSVSRTTTIYSKADEIMEQCEGRIRCATRVLADLQKTQERDTVLVTVKDLVAKYEESLYECHREGHELGMFFYHYTKNLQYSLSYLKPMCGGAVYHGAVEAYFMEQHETHIDPAEIEVREICPKNIENYYAVERWECFHGLGHGLSVIYGKDVFSALDRCDELDLGWERVNCYNGVFMQNIINYYKSRNGALDEDDLFYPCNSVKDDAIPSCYHRQTDHIYRKSRSSLDNSFKKCDRVVPEEFVRYCYFGLERQIFYRYTAPSSDNDLSLACQKGQDKYNAYCVRGLARTIADARNIDEAFRFCGNIEEKFKADCYDIVGQWSYMLHDTEEGRTKECVKARDQKYLDTCMNAEIETIKVL